MSLAAGARLGPYEVLGLIGVGGMGEVYTARDTRLDRTVAIKVLPPDVSADPDRRARFKLEGKTIAALNHPHICTLYDVGEHASGSAGGAVLYLVMEHLTGDTLARRLQRGPLPLAQALIVATEMADALTAAHRHGVIHRDLKPGNVMLTNSGAKLLDFGLAKLTGHGEQPVAADMVSEPTRSAPLTGQGVILGTLPYMAPEQLEGKPADARTDLWALGAIAYEMVTGKRAFEATSAASLIGAILEREPASLATLQPLTPPGLDRLVRQCLAKVPDDRPDTAHDLASELHRLRECTDVGAPTDGRPTPSRWRLLRAAALVLGGALVSAALTSWLWSRWRPLVSPASVVRTSLDVRPAEELSAGFWPETTIWFPTPGGAHTALTWTPDGRALLFIGRRGGTQQLYVRTLNQDEARPLAGTEGAHVAAVSPDGYWVAFWADETLKKVPLAGGPVVDVASNIDQPPMGLSWDDRGSLYFAKVTDRRIWKVATDGGVAPVTTGGEAGWSEILPWPLPGGQTLLYTVRKREWSWGDEEVVAQTLATGTRTVLLRDAADARYVATGHLVFLRRGVLFAVAFDRERLKVRGTPVALFDDVAQALTAMTSADVTGAGQFAIATTGTLAWVSGRGTTPYPSSRLVVVDRHGQVSPLPAPQKSYFFGVQLAPGGRQVAVPVWDPTEISLWTYDFARGTLTPVVRGGEAYFQRWTPDGERLVFSWVKDGRPALALQRVDGTTPLEVPGVGMDVAPSSWTPDGRQLLVATFNWDLAVVNFENGRARMQPLMHTPYLEGWPEVSPDGRWLAYGSNVSGRNEVYVQPYPGPGPRTQVSAAGGESPAWRANGHELFFISLLDTAKKRHMMVAPFEPGPPARIGTVQSLFEFSDPLWWYCAPTRCYDVAPDGQQFYGLQEVSPSPPPVVTHINLVQNWFEELKAKVPAE